MLITDRPLMTGHWQATIPRRQRLFRGFLVLLCGLLLLEGLCRVGFAVGRSRSGSTPRPAPSQLAFYVERPWGEGMWEEQRRVKLVYRPYVETGVADVAGQYINSSGFERRTFDPGVGPEAPEVWCFGGSAMWGVGARDEHTIASELARVAAHRGVPLRVRNYACLDWVSTQSLLQLTLLLRDGQRPAVALFYNGWSDLDAALQEGAGPGAPSAAGEMRLKLDHDPLRAWLVMLRRDLPRRSSLCQAWRLLQAKLRERQASRSAGGPDPLVGLTARTVDCYLANLEAARRLGELYGFEVRFLWQPSVEVSRAPADVPQASPGSEAARFWRLCQEALAARQPAGLIDLSGVLDGATQPCFYDRCQLYEPANALVARAIADFILGSDESTPAPSPPEPSGQ